MEANSKLQKKKRIAHSHMSKSNFDGPKLPPDDFVFNIMKDMDSKNIMSSYQLLQDTNSKKKQDTSQNKGRNMKNSNRDSYCKKQEKKLLPKKSFPLMQKCQTSLKYLGKNRSIPKPRAHVGSIPKLPKQPATFAEPSISSSKTEKGKDSVRRTKIQSKVYSQVIESNVKRDSNIKLQLNNTTEKGDLITQSNQDIDSSNSDGDEAYENFIKEAKNESKIASDCDSDSRLTICRKKSKSKQRRKKSKRQSISYDMNKYISKVTSIPLSDSSDSQSEDAFEVNQRSKRKRVLSKRPHEQVPTNPLEYLQSDSSLDELPDLNTNNSSEEDFCVEAKSPIVKNTEPTTDFIDRSMPAMKIGTAKVSSFKSISKVTDQQSDHNLASISVDSITLANQPMIGKGLDISKSDELVLSNSKSVQECQVPCCVLLKRDPIIEQKADTYISTKYYSALDCIILSDESDDEASTALPSNDLPLFSSNPQHKGTCIRNSDSSNFEEIEDCIIMCELPKVGSSSKLNSESMNSPTKSISIDFRASHEQSTAANDINLTSTEINCQQSSNSDETATHVPFESTSETIEEFKVQIVAVKSLVEQSENSLIAKSEEANEIEIVDLSDDDLYSQKNDCLNINFEGVKQLGEVQLTKEGIHHNVSDIPFISNDQNRGSQTQLSNPQQNSFEESPVQVNSKFLEVLNKIDFNSIKEIINKTNSINSESSIAGETLMTNEKHHSSKLSTERLLPCFNNKNVSNTDAAIQGIDSARVVSMDTVSEFTSKPNASKREPFVNAGKTTCTAKMNAELSNNIYVGEDNTSTILNSESNPIEVPGTGNQIVTVCDNFQKAREKALMPVAMDSQLNSVKQIKVIDPKTTIDSGQSECLSRTINDKKRKDIAINVSVIKRPKFEIFESPSDELDVIAASFTKDLSTPNIKVDALLNLYKAEYAKYMNIINTEANVTLGLKMLHNKQLEKLTHLRSSIKNLVKHDPCYHTVIQEKFDSKAQACSKNEEKLKQNILIPTCSSEKNDTSVQAKTDIEMGRASSVMKSESESPSHPKLEGKPRSSEDQEAGTLAQSAVAEQKPVITTQREKFLKYMRNIKCAECGKPATARCQGCAQVFYCSSECGVLSWKKGHNIACRRRM